MITDFVHLNWMFVEKDGYPRNDGPYICLYIPMRLQDECRLAMLYHEEFVDGHHRFVNGDEIEYVNVIAWADPTKYTFTCDPDKNDKCGKDVCFNSSYSDHSRTCCYLTTHLEYAKDYDFH